MTLNLEFQEKDDADKVAKKTEKVSQSFKRQKMQAELQKIYLQEKELIEMFANSANSGDSKAVEIVKISEAKMQLADSLLNSYFEKSDKAVTKEIMLEVKKDWLYHECISEYHAFVKRVTNLPITAAASRLKEFIKSADYIAMRKICEVFRQFASGNDHLAFTYWCTILSPDIWDKMPKFIQNGITIVQIRMNMISIFRQIAQLNNSGHVQTSFSSKSRSDLERIAAAEILAGKSSF